MNVIACWLLTFFNAIGVPDAKASAYNPLLVSSNAAPVVIDLEVVDKQRKRTIPVRAYLPATNSPAPEILFSHGLGGSREGSTFLGKHWRYLSSVAYSRRRIPPLAGLSVQAPLIATFA